MQLFLWGTMRTMNAPRRFNRLMSHAARDQEYSQCDHQSFSRLNNCALGWIAHKLFIMSLPIFLLPQYMISQPPSLFSRLTTNTSLTPKSHSFPRPVFYIHTHYFICPFIRPVAKMEFSIADTFFALVALTSANVISVPGEVFPRVGVLLELSVR
jgi:hypothetical protein